MEVDVALLHKVPESHGKNGVDLILNDFQLQTSIAYNIIPSFHIFRRNHGLIDAHDQVGGTN